MFGLAANLAQQVGLVAIGDDSSHGSILARSNNHYTRSEARILLDMLVAAAAVVAALLSTCRYQRATVETWKFPARVQRQQIIIVEEQPGEKEEG